MPPAEGQGWGQQWGEGAVGLVARRRVAAVGAVPDAITRLRARLEPNHEFMGFLSGADLLQYLETTRPEVVVMLGTVQDYPLPELLAELHARTADWDPKLSVVFVGPAELLTTIPPECDELLLYRIAWHDEQTAFSTVGSLVEQHRARHAIPVAPAQDAKFAPVLMAAGKVAEQVESASLRAAVESAAAGLLQAERAYCLFFDSSDGTLWREGCEREGERFTGSEGLAALAARCGQTLFAPMAMHDPRYVAHRDDPAGRGDEQLLVQPVPSANGEIHAVIVVARARESARFGLDAVAKLQRFAAALSPILDAHDAAEVFEDTSVSGRIPIFRKEAIEAARGPSAEGDVVRVSPQWVRHVTHLTIVMAVVAFFFVCLAEVGTYREGPAVVRIAGYTDVTSNLAGTITAIEVDDGQLVREGTPLLRLDDQSQRTELARLQEQFDQALMRVLQDPSDDTSRRQVADLRAQVDAAKTKLGERIIYAPHEGVVQGMRVRPGQSIAPGDPVASVVKDSTELSVTALLPGDAGAMLQTGQELRLELTAHGRAYQDLRVETIDNEVIGPTEARRFLGPELADTVNLQGPVVLVHARLPSAEFELDGTTYKYREGMSGLARVRLRSEKVAFALLPALREVF